MSTIYKNKHARTDLMNLYDEKLKSLEIDYEEIDIATQHGRTRVVKAGNPNGKKIVLFHGYNAGAPITLEAILGIMDNYCFYAVETVGQATKSEEIVMNIKDDSFAIWADEVLEKLNIEDGNIVGISYGGFIVQKLIAHRPERVGKSILVVPAGIVNGNFWESMTKLTFPLIRYNITKKDKHLTSFLNAFIPDGDSFILRMLSTIMKGVKLDTRIPPLLKAKAIQHFNQPVYIIAAKNDVHFPGEKMLKRAKELFNNLQEVYLLKNSKHMPSSESFGIIQQKIKEWVN